MKAVNHKERNWHRWGEKEEGEKEGKGKQEVRYWRYAKKGNYQNKTGVDVRKEG